MNRFRNQWSGKIVYAAFAVLIAFGCQRLDAQSATTPPKPSPRVTMLEAQIAESLVKKDQVEKSLLSVREQNQLLETELVDLKKLEREMSVTAESYPEVLKTLHSQRIQMTIDLAGIEARYRAIEE